MHKKLISILILSVFASTAFADPHIVNEVYDKNRVYDIYSRGGKVTLLQLESDEVLTTSGSALGVGDAKGWDLGVRGNNIILKPAGEKPNTNIVIATNKRTYAFELKTASKDHPTTYIIRFRFPDTEDKKTLADMKIALMENQETLKRERLTQSAKLTKPILNTEYSWIGDNALLKPTTAWDDGRFTHLTYDNAAEMPNFYKVMPDGSEALLNTNIDPKQGNTVVLQELIRRVRARLGKDVIEIVNDNYQVPAFNKTGSSEIGAVRIGKGVF